MHAIATQITSINTARSTPGYTPKATPFTTQADRVLNSAFDKALSTVKRVVWAGGGFGIFRVKAHYGNAQFFFYRKAAI